MVEASSGINVRTILDKLGSPYISTQIPFRSAAVCGRQVSLAVCFFFAPCLAAAAAAQWSTSPLGDCLSRRLQRLRKDR